MHRAGRHRPPHWKRRAVQAPASGSSPYNTARSQTDQHPTLNQQTPETGFSKEKLKSGVPRGPPWHSPKPLPRPHRFSQPHRPPSLSHHAVGQGLWTTYLRHCVLWDGGKVGGGEGEAAVCPCIVRIKIEDHLLLPAAPLTQVQTVNAHEPVRAGDNAYHEGHLDGSGRFSSCSPRTHPLLDQQRLTSECLGCTSSSVEVCPVPLGTAGAENTACTLWSFSPAASISFISAQASPRSANSLSPLLTYSFFLHML